MPAKQKSGIGAAGGRLFCWPRMRTAALAAAFIVLLAPDALANKPQARRPWLLFPIDVRRFDHVSSRFGMRRLAGHRQLHRGVDLVAPSGSWVVAAREGRVGEVGSTGHSTGPHLHFSLLDEAGQARDPLRSLYTPAETLQVLRHMGLAR